MAHVRLLNSPNGGASPECWIDIGCTVCGINLCDLCFCDNHVCSHVPCTDCGPDCNPVE
jgi:hypothetical protein